MVHPAGLELFNKKKHSSFTFGYYLKCMVRAAGVEPACVQLPFLRLRRPRGYARICHNHI